MVYRQVDRRMEVFFYEAFEEEARALKELLEGSISCGYTAQTIQETGQEAPPARIISIRTQSVVPVSWADKIDGVLSRSTGYDHLAAYLAKVRKSLPCGYLEEYATRAVAEQGVLLLLALLRKLPQQTTSFPLFQRDGLTGEEWADKNLLIVGVGRIGGEIATLARGLGLNVKGVDPILKHSHLDYVSATEGMRWADAVICAMNLTEENKGYFSYDRLKQAQRGIIFVNIARGEHSPAAGLLKLLQEGHLGAVGLDVYENEPSLAVSLRNPQKKQAEEVEIIKEMTNYPNVIFTPHNAFNTRQAVVRKAWFTVEQIRYFKQHRDFQPKVVL